MRKMTTQPLGHGKRVVGFVLHDVADKDNILGQELGDNPSQDDINRLDPFYEGVLQLVIEQFKLSVQRCKETLDTTPLFLCSWLYSQLPEKSGLSTFAWLANESSAQDYITLWIRLLCLLFRARKLGSRVEKKVVDIYQHLNRDTKEHLYRVWLSAYILYCQRSKVRLNDRSNRAQAHLTRLESRGFTLEQDIQERLMALSINLITQPLTGWSKTTNNVLLYFVGILSFDITTYEKTNGQRRNFIPTSSSTSYIASLVWCGRLFGLEYALPSRAYPVVGWPARETHVDCLSRL